MSNKENDDLDMLHLDVLDLIDKYQHVKPYELANILISVPVTMLLECAPDHLVAIKTVMACVETGINRYERENNIRD